MLPVQPLEQVDVLANRKPFDVAPMRKGNPTQVYEEMGELQVLVVLTNILRHFSFAGQYARGISLQRMRLFRLFDKNQSLRRYSIRLERVKKVDILFFQNLTNLIVGRQRSTVTPAGKKWNLIEQTALQTGGRREATEWRKLQQKKGRVIKL